MHRLFGARALTLLVYSRTIPRALHLLIQFELSNSVRCQFNYSVYSAGQA